VLFSPEIALIVFTQPWLSSFMGCRWVLQPLFRKQWQGVGLSLSSSSFFLWYGLSLLLDKMRFKIVCLSFSCCFSFVGMWGKTLNLCAYVCVCLFLPQIHLLVTLSLGIWFKLPLHMVCLFAMSTASCNKFLPAKIV
jgi:hypothetical protein